MTDEYAPTSRDESLRALEKGWRAAGDAETARADGIGLSDGEQGWHHGRGEQYENCADELAAILATASEQAPVAEIGELNGTKLIVGRDEDALARLPKGTKLYTFPAHTSEARDAEIALEWLGRQMRTSTAYMDGSAAFNAASFAMRKHDLRGRTFLEAVIAAMRQEAE